MTIVLDGTLGITAPVVTTPGASINTNISYTGTLTGGTGVVNLGSGQLVKDAAGNLGIGTSSPVAKLAVVGGTSNASSLATAYSLAAFNITPKSSSGYSLQFGSGPSDLPYIQMSAGGAASGDITIQPYGGNLLVGATSNPTSTTKVYVYGDGGMSFKGVSSVNNPIVFYGINNATAGYIQINANTTGYITSSDYRLKENIKPMLGALIKIALLKPVIYSWKETGISTQGFIAHELAEVIPECVFGEKDAIDAEGKPQYQGIDTSFLVATIAAAIQEQQALIEALTTRLTALENK